MIKVHRSREDALEFGLRDEGDVPSASAISSVNLAAEAFDLTLIWFDRGLQDEEKSTNPSSLRSFFATSQLWIGHIDGSSPDSNGP